MDLSSVIARIKTQRQQNVTDESIRNNLLSNQIPPDIIDNAFISLAVANMGQGAVELSQRPLPALDPMPSKTRAILNQKPKAIYMLSSVLFIIAGIYVFSAISILALVLIMGRAFGSLDVFSFLKYFPLFGIVPILLACAAWVFFYIAIKVRCGSKSSLWFSVVSLVGIPITVGSVGQWAMSSFISQVKNFGQLGEKYASIASGPVRLRLDDPIIILAFVGIALILLSCKDYRFRSEPISKKSKIFLSLVFMFLVVPVILTISYDYLKAQDTDYGFTKISQSVRYHVYKPQGNPVGLTYTTKFTGGKEMAGKEDAIQLALDIPFDEMLKNKPIRLTVLRQVGVETGFDIENFASTYMQAITLQKINLDKAVNQTAYHLEKVMKNSTLHALVYLTSDNVLITIISPRSSLDQLVEIAMSLE